MVQTAGTWRELARFDDASLARAVATSIASMEFDVRVRTARKQATCYRIEVHHAHWGDLAEVLDEIVDEQMEFDRALADRGAGHDAAIIIIVLLSGTVDLLALMRLLDA